MIILDKTVKVNNTFYILAYEKHLLGFAPETSHSMRKWCYLGEWRWHENNCIGKEMNKLYLGCGGKYYILGTFLSLFHLLLYVRRHKVEKFEYHCN